ncbi:MAG: DUF262 domain-containing protein [Burkholderiaceae bacterium]
MLALGGVITQLPSSGEIILVKPTAGKPLITESSTSESTTVEVVMNDMRDETLRIPDYQRDADQWDDATKSLFIESVINNLTIPAFFFEPTQEKDIEVNDVVDGQQRLTTLFSFFNHKFRLVPHDIAAYLSPDRVHYAGKTYDELPLPYQQAFKKYRLTIIKLRQLGAMRLEVFRRINQGGTPLSAHDIRLAYYGENSPSVSFLRLVGIYDVSRAAGQRFIASAEKNYGMEHPWAAIPLESWSEWWSDKEIARGQMASESFLLAAVSAQHEKLDSLLKDDGARGTIGIRFVGAMDEALDAAVAQMQYQDKRKDTFEPVLFSFDELKDKFFPFYEEWITTILSMKIPNLSVTKHRLASSVIGAAYQLELDINTFSNPKWKKLEDFIRRPQESAKTHGVDWPQSKGRWDGQKGYRAQFEAINKIVKKIAK